MPLPLTLHLVGDFPPGRIHCSWTPSTFSPPPGVRSLIDSTWDQVRGSRPNVNLFDGPMCRLESHGVAHDALNLSLSRTSYKAFLGTNMHHPEVAERYGPASLANPVGLSCALVAADGPLMLGRRNGRVAYYPSRVHPFAGALEPREPMDLFAEVKRELQEELAFGDADLADLRCLGLAEDRSLRQPELIFLASSTRTSEEIAKRVDAKEHVASVRIPDDPAEASRAIGDPLLTPIAVATILLWGRQAFGQEWFETATARTPDGTKARREG